MDEQSIAFRGELRMICAKYGCDYQLDLDGQITCSQCGAMDDDMLPRRTYNEKITEKCHYCEEDAKYDDTIESDQEYFVSGVCEKHAFKGLVS